MAVNNDVYNYTTKINRPLDLVEARLRNSSSIDISMTALTREDYMVLSDKSTTGIPSQVFYDPQLTNSRLYIWPVSDLVTNKIVMTLQTPLEDFDAGSDDPQFPVEWLYALRYSLAYELSFEYSGKKDKDDRHIISETKISRIKIQAEESLETAKGFDNVKASYFFVPNLRYSYDSNTNAR